MGLVSWRQYGMKAKSVNGQKEIVLTQSSVATFQEVATSDGSQ